MTLEQALQAISEGRWSEDRSRAEWYYDGDKAFGQPSWVVQDRGGYGSIKRTLVWYEQNCDFYSYGTLVKVARAMDAAQKTILNVLRED